MEMFADTASYRPADDDNAQRTPPYYPHALNLKMSIDDAIESTMTHYGSVFVELKSNRRKKMVGNEDKARLDDVNNRKLALLHETIVIELKELGYEGDSDKSTVFS